MIVDVSRIFVITTAPNVAQSQYALGAGDIYVVVHHAFQRLER